MEKILSKSKYMNGLQCPKLLWVGVNDKARLPEVSESQQKIFDEGHLVGEFAKKLFPAGIDIADKDFSENLKVTKSLLKENKPLFEAGFLVNRVYSRADILEPVEDGWNIVEVKSSTEVKDENISDVAFQKYVYEKAGLKIKKCFLLHINNQYVRAGELNLNELFRKEDISLDVEEELKLVDARVKAFLDIIDGKEPNVKINESCSKPYECPLKGNCWDFLPKENCVFDLYRGGKRSWELFECGVLSIKDIPKGTKLSDKQEIQLKCEQTGEVHINREAVSKFLEEIKFPIYFLDFESYQTAIPLYDGLKPYQQIPFQFSVHKIDRTGKKTHYSFISAGKKDPRRKFMNAINLKVGKKGSIIVYNQSFEAGRLREIAQFFPEEKKRVEGIIDRMVDLLIPFREFNYYSRKQEGSASIKYVLPAMSDLSYKEMEISNGGQASMKYAYITHGKLDETKATREEIKKVRDDLKKYCGLDTEAMIVVLDGLRRAVE